MPVNHLSQFQDCAEEYIKRHQNSILVDFEHNHYTVQIPSEDAPNGFWNSSLIFDERNCCSEAFCDCPDGDCCEHLMIAYLSAYDCPRISPLHTKFAQSFWYHLFLRCFLGNLTWQKANADDNLWILTTEEFTIQACHPEHIGPLNHTHSCEQFTSSPFYTFAKYLFILCEQRALLHISQDTDNFPSGLFIQEQNFFIRVHITAPSLLTELFPRINFFRTTLTTLIPYALTLSSAHVDCETESICFRVQVQRPSTQAGIPIGNVIYFLPENGWPPFIWFPEQQYTVPICSASILSSEIKLLLSDLCDLSTPHRIHYRIFRNCDSSFHFSAYLKIPGDLQHAKIIQPNYCCISDNDSNVPKKKLIVLQGLLSTQTMFSVPANDVAQFVEMHRNDIQEEDCKVFDKPSKIEGLPKYYISPEGVLFFNYEIGIRYDQWVYYLGFGFYPYADASGIRQVVPDGLNVPFKDVPQFITEHASVLQMIPDFFSSSSTLRNIIFQVHAVNHSQLKLRPIFEGLEHRYCRLFGPYLYQDQLGFSLLPDHLQSLSSIPLSVEASDVPDFISEYTNHAHVVFPEPETRQPKTLQLNILSIQRPAASVVYLELELQTDIGSIPVKDLLKHLKNKKTFLFSQAGFLNFQLYFFRLLRSFITNKQYIADSGILIVSVTDIYKLDVLAPLSLASNVQASPEDLEFFYQVKNLSSPPLPHELFATHHNLRPYQSAGLLWLWFLYHHHLSGLLCDEMGLGKTHQAAALLDAAYQSAKQDKEQAKFLIVCPASVLSHWEQILARHLPKDVSIFLFHSASKPDIFPAYDVMITSYGTLRRHLPLFSSQTFTIAVFDEVHIAKNKTSQVHKALRLLDARMKLGLTGTPIENNLFEFKNLIDIILPRYLPSDADLKKMIAQDKAVQDPQHLLFKMTRPFILKRTKQKVLPDLPDKVEATILCLQSPEQQSLYARTERDYFTKQYSGTEEERALRYLALFCHLKQICDHPAVFLKQPEQYKNHTSGKWDKFVELLQESLAAGYKVVVFSQYIHMIQIITLYLKEHGIKYASIQGQTIHRKEEIAAFTNDPECKVFVGSLLAAGTGINLTSGNVVILYDRWWNYAKESQALDRVHRIGQKQKVFIYKFITEGTIEEKIQNLIEEKRLLLAATQTSDDELVFPSLNAEDLRMILSYQDKLYTDTVE